MVDAVSEGSLLKPFAADNTKTVPEPPNGGYGWVIVFASFCMSTIIAIGGMYGVFYIELLEYFQESNALTAGPASLNIGFGLGAGPLASILSNRVGHRMTGILGGTINAVGFLVCAFATNIYHWFLGYGVLCGIGYSLQFVTLTVMAGSYFTSRRNLATGLALSGVGVGIFLNAPLLDASIKQYSLRGAAIIFSALSLQACVFASLLRPLPGITDRQDQDERFLPDANLLKDWRLLLFAFVEFMWNIGASIYFSLLPDFAYTRGILKSESGMLLSYLGIGSLTGRLVLAFGTNCKSCNTTLLYAVTTCVGGIIMFITISSAHYVAFVLCSTLYGVCFGLQASLSPVIVVNLFGLARMTSAFGYLLLGGGLGCIIGPLLAGFIYDYTVSYTISWFTSGTLTCLASVLMLPLALRTFIRATVSSSEIVAIAIQPNENTIQETDLMEPITMFKIMDEKLKIVSIAIQPKEYVIQESNFMEVVAESVIYG